MGDKSSIEWLRGSDGSAGSTWNPLRARNLETDKIGWHCERVSKGCERCYAETQNVVCGNNPGRNGTGLHYIRSSREKVQIFLDKKTLEQPMHWKKPRRIFVCSMTDLFGEFHTDQMVDKVFAVMALCPQHTFQILTKRAERMHSYLTGRPVLRLHDIAPHWPLPNVHLGVSVEDQKTADERIPWLLKTPAAVRWISYEPALGPVDFRKYLSSMARDQWEAEAMEMGAFREGPFLDWLVVGGESGPSARPLNVKWTRDTIAQCKAAGIPCYVKQLGRRPYYGDTEPHEDSSVSLKNKKGSDPSEWPEDLRVREYPDA